MERALAYDQLVAALGQHPDAPNPEELASLLAEAEVNLLTGRAEVSTYVVQAGWYLHAVASAAGVNIAWDRRARAFRVSAHILELAGVDESRPTAQRLQLLLGAELGYRRGGLDPNATAVYMRSHQWFTELSVENPGWRSTLAIEAAVIFLSFNTSRFYDWANAHRSAFTALRVRTGLGDLAGTMFGPAEHVLEACRDFMRFLMLGDRGSLEIGRSRLRRLFGDDAEAATVDERWVAAHLLVYSDELDAGSPWTCLPPDVPDAARRALTHTSPPVLTLWEPQRELLAPDAEGSHLLAADTKRAILSIPTSAGKTLIAQVLVLAELARNDRSVCLIAPQRSLVREIRRSLLPRVRALQKRLSPDAPDFLADLALDVLQDGQPPDIELLTPERFATMLRADPENVLDRFGLFIFDEAHLIGDASRGFTLEGALSYLHWRTLETDHRIVLMSAVIGDDAAFQDWLRVDKPLKAFRSLWRGPRRLSIAFTTKPDWQLPEDRPPIGKGTVHRTAYPLYGSFSLNIPGSGPTTLTSSEPVGSLVMRKNRGRADTKDPSTSTPHYRHVATAATFLEHAGPVLTVTLTRPDSQRLAGAIADMRQPVPAMRRASEAVGRILDESHPLVAMLDRGVAYHHAGLPTDVLTLIEDELRAGNLRQLVSTTTLTEGVNLPVHTVILAETRWQGNALHISGPRMLNAIGRAGRAGIETEGWVVFAPNGKAPADPGAHLPDPDELIIHSALSSVEVLDALKEFEAKRGSASDAVFSELPEELQQFTSFVWYLLACEEALDAPVDDERLKEAISSLFVAQELVDEDFDRLVRFAHDVHDTYDGTDGAQRRAWARTGTTIASARKIDEMAETLAVAAEEYADVPPGARKLVDQLKAEEKLGDLGAAINLLEATGLLDAILELPEVDDGAWEFRVSPHGQHIYPDLADTIRHWTAGDPIAEIADEALPDVPDRTLRIEQMVDAISRGFGHSISWMIAAILERTNNLLALRLVPPLCPALPLYVRFGVDSSAALQLVTGQVRNRRVAVLVARAAQQAEKQDDLREWLTTVPIEEWRTLFNAGPSDVLDLLNYASDSSAAILRSLIEGSEIDLPLEQPATPGEANITVRRDESDIALVWVTTIDGQDIPVGSQWQADLQNVLATGLEFTAQVTDTSSLLLTRAEA